MLRSFLLPAALLGLTTAPPSPCDPIACRCVPAEALQLTPAEFVGARRDRAERVVLGTVIRFDTLPRTVLGTGDNAILIHPIAARIRVSRVWRGSATDTMTVMLTAVEMHSTCDVTLRRGDDYVIFATRMEGSLLATRQCTGTVAARDAAEVLEILGPGQSVRP